MCLPGTGITLHPVFNDTATTEIYTLSLHDALPISADPFSSLGTFSSSSIGGPVIHPIVDCEHPLLCLLGPGLVSQETAIGWIIGPPMEELEKVPKELKGSATL